MRPQPPAVGASVLRSMMQTPSPTILSLPEALEAVRAQAAALPASRQIEEAALADAGGRVLARAVAADRDQPPFDRSTRDGFAVRVGDLHGGARLRVIGQVRAGEVWQGDALTEGSAIALMTGAPLPAGADAVVMVEHVTEAAQTITLAAGRTLRTGENVVPRGSEAAAGEVVLPAGTHLSPAGIALAAACGCAVLHVFAQPQVAILATGDELVEVGVMPLAHQIRNSNSYALAALVTAAGGEAVRFPISADRREELERNIREASRCDLILLSGGVSMGKYDLVEEMLLTMGAEFFFTGVRMQPGRPVVFGRMAGGPYLFGLPGNPVSTEVTFHCFVAPFLKTLCGGDIGGPRFAQATLAEDVQGKAGLHRLLPAWLSSDLATPRVALVGWQGSGDMTANARANCYAVLPPERERFAAGDVITILLP